MTIEALAQEQLELYFDTDDLTAFFEKAAEPLLEAWETVKEVIEAWWEEFSLRISAWYEELQRDALYVWMCRWVPNWVAEPVARYWPRGWIPNNPFELFDKSEQKS